VTKFDDIFSGYQLCQVSVLNWRFKDHLSHHRHHHQGSDPWWWWPRWSSKYHFNTDT